MTTDAAAQWSDASWADRQAATSGSTPRHPGDGSELASPMPSVASATHTHESNTTSMPSSPMSSASGNSHTGAVAPLGPTTLSMTALHSQQQQPQHAHAHAHNHHSQDDEEDEEGDEGEEGGAAGGAAEGARTKRSSHGSSCHQCKTTKDPQFLFFCTNKAEKGVRKRRCRKKYCDSCLKRSYVNDLSEIIPSWQCPSCLGLCICAACHRKSSKRGAAAAAAAPAAVAAGGGQNQPLHAGAALVDGPDAEVPPVVVVAPSPSSTKRSIAKVARGESPAGGAIPRQIKRESAQRQQQQTQSPPRESEFSPDSGLPPPIPASSLPLLPLLPPLGFSLASPNPLLGGPVTGGLMTPNGTNYDLSTYPTLTDESQVDLEALSSGGGSRMHHSYEQQQQYGGQQAYGNNNNNYNGNNYNNNNLLPPNQQHQQFNGSTFQHPQRSPSYGVDTDDESAAGGIRGGVGGGDGNDDESDYGSVYQPSSRRVSGIPAASQQQQPDALSHLTASHSQSDLLRHAALSERRAMEEGSNVNGLSHHSHAHGHPHPGSMSTPAKTRSISSSAAMAARLGISPLAISRGSSGTEVSHAHSGSTSGGPLVDGKLRMSPRFSARTLSGKGNSNNISPRIPLGGLSGATDPDGAGGDALYLQQQAELESLMVGMNMAQRQSFLHEAVTLAQGSLKGTSPLGNSPRSAKRKLAPTAGGSCNGGGNGGQALAGGPAPVDLSMPNQHLKYQMVARLKSQLVERDGPNSASESSTTSPVLNNPSDEEVMMRTRLLQGQQQQLRMQATAKLEQQTRIQNANNAANHASPSAAPAPRLSPRHDLNIHIKAEPSFQRSPSPTGGATVAASASAAPAAPAAASAAAPGGLPPSHTQAAAGARRAHQPNLPSPLTYLTSPNSASSNGTSNASASPASSYSTTIGGQQQQSLPQQPPQQPPSLFSPLPGGGSSSGSNSGSGVGLGLETPSMLGMLGVGDTSNGGGLFSPPAPMFPTSHAHLMPGANGHFEQQPHASQQSQSHSNQPDYLQWGAAPTAAAAAAAAANNSSLGLMSPLPGSLMLNFPNGGAMTPGGANGMANGMSMGMGMGHGGGLFSPNPATASPSLFGPSASAPPLSYPSSAHTLPPMNAGLCGGSSGGGMFPRQMSAGGQNALMGDRGSSANGTSAFFDMGQNSPMHTFSP